MHAGKPPCEHPEIFFGDTEDLLQRGAHVGNHRRGRRGWSLHAEDGVERGGVNHGEQGAFLPLEGLLVIFVRGDFPGASIGTNGFPMGILPRNGGVPDPFYGAVLAHYAGVDDRGSAAPEEPYMFFYGRKVFGVDECWPPAEGGELVGGVARDGAEPAEGPGRGDAAIFAELVNIAVITRKMCDLSEVVFQIGDPVPLTLCALEFMLETHHVPEQLFGGEALELVFAHGGEVW